MRCNLIKYFILASGAFIFLQLFPEDAPAYTVSGLVEFSYRNYETKIGSVKTSSSDFVQNYQANISTFIWDPRFLQFNGGVGYQIHKRNDSADFDSLNYNANLAFFQGRMISWDFFGQKTTTSNATYLNIAGYDVTTTSYGGTLRLNLSKTGRNGNNNGNNNNNNNFNNGNRSNWVLPDIELSRSRTDAVAQSALVPLDETRENTRIAVKYFYSRSFDLIFTDDIESYKNNISNYGYDVNTASLVSNIMVSPSGKLVLTGRRTERATDNMIGYAGRSLTSLYSASLNFAEKNGFSHFHHYDYSEQKEGSRELINHNLGSQVRYRLTSELSVRGGLTYRQADFTQAATATTPEEKSSLTSGALLAGVSYAKIYRPDFMGPFSLSTGYDFMSGFSKVESQSASIGQGSGTYYTNNANIRFNSDDWRDENLSASYAFANRRDQSPVANNTQNQSYNLDFLTRRIPKTIVKASAAYNVQDQSSNTADVFYTMMGNQNTQRRTVIYNADIARALTRELRVNLGATKSSESATQTYTLSTLQPSSSTNEFSSEVIYATASYSTFITRSLNYQAELREERRTAYHEDYKTHQISQYLYYRIRAILVSLEYRWRQDDPENGETTTQQMTYMKISRPF